MPQTATPAAGMPRREDDGAATLRSEDDGAVTPRGSPEDDDDSFHSVDEFKTPPRKTPGKKDGDNNYKKRFKELQKHASPNINIVLVGNKKDLGETRRAVSREDARAFANENGMAMECEASALSGEGVVEIFKSVAMSLWR